MSQADVGLSPPAMQRKVKTSADGVIITFQRVFGFTLEPERKTKSLEDKSSKNTESLLVKMLHATPV